VSEIMLQQTQVATVEAYFSRFLRAFPTLRALARADRQDVLRQWEGLGYYRRATQLHEAAQIVVSEHAGEFPRDFDAVVGLPGIGRYTAGAILSIAFDQRRPILEANTTRLLSRLLAHRGNPSSSEGQRVLWAFAEAILPRKHVGTFNQALMELGGAVCTVRSPRCDECPVAPLCRARHLGLQHEIPSPKPKRAFETVREAAVVIRRRGRVLLVRCAEGERWAGLWDFPRFSIRAEETAALGRELAARVRQRTGVRVELGRHLKTIKHGVTRFRITLECYQAEYLSQRDGKPSSEAMRWVRPAELDEYPLNSTGRRLAELAKRNQV
jgi:A/G-specific adenine glycosylase